VSATVSAVRDARELGLTFERTLSRQLVHKAAVDQVLLTDAVQLGEREFAFGSQLPRSHSYYSDSILEAYDQLLVLEIGRQAAVLAAHEFLDVPRNSQFIFSNVDAQVHELEALRRTSRPKEVALIMSLADERRRRGQLTACELRGDYYIDGGRSMSMRGAAVFFDRDRYQALRRHMRKWVRPEPVSDPPEPLAPAEVGRRDAANVVIGQAAAVGGESLSYQSELIVRESHATFFDHPLDHVPGALLIEACRQTALVSAAQAHDLPAAEAYVEEYAARYERLAELGASVRCRAEVGAAGRADGRCAVPVDISLVQFGSEIAQSRFVLVSER
jgi:hypothetical protein